MPANVRNNVVLPLPLEPLISTTLPRPTLRSKFEINGFSATSIDSAVTVNSALELDSDKIVGPPLTSRADPTLMRTQLPRECASIRLFR